MNSTFLNGNDLGQDSLLWINILVVSHAEASNHSSGRLYVWVGVKQVEIWSRDVVGCPWLAAKLSPSCPFTSSPSRVEWESRNNRSKKACGSRWRQGDHCPGQNRLNLGSFIFLYIYIYESIILVFIYVTIGKQKQNKHKKTWGKHFSSPFSQTQLCSKLFPLPCLQVTLGPFGDASVCVWGGCYGQHMVVSLCCSFLLIFSLFQHGFSTGCSP